MVEDLGKLMDYIERREVIGKEALWKEFEMAHNLSLDNYRDIVQNIYRHCDELVLDDSFSVRKLIGIMSDNDDHYYILEDMRGNKTYGSCVGGFFLLKNKMDDEDYFRMEYVWSLNDGKFERFNEREKKEFKEFFKIT
jgi:hypothetical protein